VVVYGEEENAPWAAVGLVAVAAGWAAAAATVVADGSVSKEQRTLSKVAVSVYVGYIEHFACVNLTSGILESCSYPACHYSGSNDTRTGDGGGGDGGGGGLGGGGLGGGGDGSGGSGGS